MKTYYSAGHLGYGISKRIIQTMRRDEPIGEVESLRDKFGAERLVYGSWYTRYAMGTMLFYLHHTDLNDEELRLVCSGNLERIMKS